MDRRLIEDELRRDRIGWTIFCVVTIVVVVFLLLAVAIAMGAQAQEKKASDKPAKATTEQSQPASKPVRTNPVTITLKADQLLCMPRTGQCITCTETDPCALYQIARQPVKE